MHETILIAYNVSYNVEFLINILTILGKRYQHFVKFQNLIDYAYIQLTTNKTVWPLYNTNENPEPDFTNPPKQCLERFQSLPDEIWVCKYSRYR